MFVNSSEEKFYLLLFSENNDTVFSINYLSIYNSEGYLMRRDWGETDEIRR